MTKIRSRNSRRQFLSYGALAAASASNPLQYVAATSPPATLKVAGVVSTYFRNSHADVIIGKILEGWRQTGGDGPALEVASLYVDQISDGDLSRSMAEKYDVPIFDNIADTLTLGTDKVQIDGVLCIGEHGNYEIVPETGQVMYPRRRFFDEVTATLEQHRTRVPIFNDKHLAYAWRDAAHMAKTAKRLKLPFLAGSSLPVAWRSPATVLPIGTKLTQACGIGYGGLESYGFHALETMQSIVERRRGGESGVQQIRTLQGDRIWEGLEAGLWDSELALATLKNMEIDLTLEQLKSQLTDGAAVYVIDYQDGLRAACCMFNGVTSKFGCGVRTAKSPSPKAWWFKLEHKFPYGHFEHLLRAIEKTFVTRRPAYPVERTLLTTGILDRCMHSLANDGAIYATPELRIRYKPSEWPFANQDSRHAFPT